MTHLPRAGWRDDAECTTTDPAAWDALPDVAGRAPRKLRPPAAWQVTMCQSCPVLVDCLAEAYVLGDREVIRGTLTLGRNPRANRRVLARMLDHLGVEVPT